MSTSPLEEQGYHLAGMLITFLFAWVGIVVAVTVERCSTKATSLLSIFAGGVLFAGGMVHLLGDALVILRKHSEAHGQLLTLVISSMTYVTLFVIHASITGHFSAKLNRVQKKQDHARLLADDDGSDDVTTTPHLDEADICIASLHKSGLRSAALLMSVLSLHSLLVGVAFGSQPDPAEEFKIMIPIAAHKSLAAMALTLTFKNARIKRVNMLVLLLIFSCSTPTGTLIGMVISASVKSALWTGCCLAVASGTFMFVTLNDIIPTEISKDSTLLVPKCVSLFLGFGLMSMLALWI